jgi:putative FmdB family regulatory protein
MPIYEYRCRKCNEKFESFRGIFSSDSKVECPVCGEKKPQRIVSRTSSRNSTTPGNLRFPT